MFQAKIHNYTIEVHNISANRWEIFDTARTLDEAFDIAADKAIGFDKNYDHVAILDMMGYVVWESTGYCQGEGKKLPSIDKITWDEEPKIVAPDGSC